MMKGFIAKLVVKPEARPEFERLQIELRKLTYENEPDAPVYELMRSQDDLNTYMVVAIFKDQAAFEKWLEVNEGDVEVYGSREVEG